MAQTSPQNSALMQPLSVGNVVSAGIRLYRSNLKPYLRVALIAVGWLLLPIVAIIPLIVVFFAAGESLSPVFGLLIPAWLILLMWGSANYLAQSALISRLAFGDLTNQPETVAEGQRHTNRSRWAFLLATALVSLILLGVMIASYLVALIVGGGAAFVVFGGFAPAASSPSPILIVVFALLVFALVVGVIGLLSWFGARFSIVEVPLAVETGLGATSATGRTWELTKGNAWRILLIMLVAFLITFPIQILAQVVVSVVQQVLSAVVSPTSSQFEALSTVLSSILSLALSVVVIPFWQAIKAVIYFDLRTRREGLGLELRDRQG